MPLTLRQLHELQKVGWFLPLACGMSQSFFRAAEDPAALAEKKEESEAEAKELVFA